MRTGWHASAGTGMDRASWMCHVPDSVLLSDVTIPGTHQSCAFHGVMARCQNPGFNVSAQLRAGIRYLDIRCRAQGGELRLYHEFVSQRAGFEAVLEACRAFLARHPSEMVLMRVRQERSTIDQSSFQRLFAGYLRESGALDRVYQQDTVPRLGAVRGRVVLISGPSYVGGLRWKDESVMNVQDYWQVRPAVKIRQVMAHLERAAGRSVSESRDQPRLFVNHLSAHWLPYYTQRAVAARVNPQAARAVHMLLEHARVHGGGAGLGVLAMDFADETSDLVDALISWNLLETPMDARTR